MARKNINLGTGYDTGDSDFLRDGGGFINSNFIELYKRATEWAPQTYDVRTTVLYENSLYFISESAQLPVRSADFLAELSQGIWVGIVGAGGGDVFTDQANKLEETNTFLKSIKAAEPTTYVNSIGGFYVNNNVGDQIFSSVYQNSSFKTVLRDQFGTEITTMDFRDDGEVWLYNEKTSEPSVPTSPYSIANKAYVDSKIVATSGESTMSRDVTASVDVGGYLKGDKALFGTLFTDVIDKLLSPAVGPTKDDATASTFGVNNKSLEIGSPYVSIMQYTYYKGAIFSADGSPDVELQGDEESHYYSGQGIDQSGNISIIVDDADYEWYLDISTEQGVGDYFDSEGELSNVFFDDRLPTSVNLKSGKVSGFYYMWTYQGVFDSAPTDTAVIRSLVNKDFVMDSERTTDILIVQGNRDVSFYVPKDTQVIDVFYPLGNTSVLNTFIKSSIQVEDANGVLTDYDMYLADIGGVGYSKDVIYKVTVKK